MSHFFLVQPVPLTFEQPMQTTLGGLFDFTKDSINTEDSRNTEDYMNTEESIITEESINTGESIITEE